MADRNKINVIIDGRNFTVVGAENESYIRQLANYVDHKIKNLATKNDKLSQTMAATLAALNIADELHKAQKSLKELEVKAKDPLEKFSGISEELQKSRVKIVELEKLCLEYKDEVIQTKLNNEEIFKEISELKEKLEFKDLELEELHKLNKNLQDKNFDNQIELIESKKELSEALKLLINERE